MIDLPQKVDPKSVTKATLVDRVADIERYHAPRYPVSAPDAQSRQDETMRRVVCNGCEVFWWPCPTIQIVRGSWIEEVKGGLGESANK